MAALTLGLNAAGHQALLHAPPENEAWVWRSQVTKLGLGPRAGLLRMLSARSLSKAVLECLGNERYRRKAEEIATAIQGTDGVDLTVRAVEAIKM
jgi:UDP:flavonoid glycosyltransferase YjiC (YdhE family)